MFSSASTSEGRGRIAAHLQATCSIVLSHVRLCTFLSHSIASCLYLYHSAPSPLSRETNSLPLHVAVLRTCLRPRPAVSICTTLRPRHSWEINDFSFTCCRSSHLSAPSPYWINAHFVTVKAFALGEKVSANADG